LDQFEILRSHLARATDPCREPWRTQPFLRSQDANADIGDVVALIGLEAVAMLVAYGRASSLKEALEALAASAPIRALLLREANGTGVPPPPLSLTGFALAPAACRAH
jgi:hypothetical protein